MSLWLKYTCPAWTGTCCIVLCLAMRGRCTGVKGAIVPGTSKWIIHFKKRRKKKTLKPPNTAFNTRFHTRSDFTGPFQILISLYRVNFFHSLLLADPRDPSAAHWPAWFITSSRLSWLLASHPSTNHRQQDAFPLTAPPPSARRHDIMTLAQGITALQKWQTIVGLWSSASDNTTRQLDWDTLQKLKDVWICLNKWRHLLKSWTLLCFTERPNC